MKYLSICICVLLRLCVPITLSASVETGQSDLVKVSNDSHLPIKVRRDAARELFQKYIKAGMTLDKVGGILERVTWLKRENIEELSLIGGYLPIEIRPGDSIFRIDLFPAADGVFVFIAFDGKLSLNQFWGAIIGEKTAPARTIRSIALLEKNYRG